MSWMGLSEGQRHIDLFYYCSPVQDNLEMKIMKTRITKRIKECAIGIVGEGFNTELFRWQRTVLDENDEPYTYDEYMAASSWLVKKLGM